MLGHCRKCPGEGGVTSFLHSIENLEERESIKYMQWVSTDRSTLETILKTVDDFIELLARKIVMIKKQHFIAKRQSMYLKDLKTTLKKDEIIVMGDFSKNYSFVVQDEVQSFHWTNNQATVHSFKYII